MEINVIKVKIPDYFSNIFYSFQTGQLIVVIRKISTLQFWDVSVLSFGVSNHLLVCMLALKIT